MSVSSHRTQLVSSHFVTANVIQLLIVSTLLIILITTQLLPCVDAGSARHSSRKKLSAVSDKTRSLTRIASVNIENGTRIGGEQWSVSTEGTVEGDVDTDETEDTEGLESSPSTLADQIEDQVPAIPSAMRTKATATSIHITWSPPKNSRITVRGYIIGWGIGFPDVYSKNLADGKQRSHTISDLSPGSEYVISLRAYNNMGDGQPAYDNVRTLQEDLSESSVQLYPPVGLKVNVLSHSSVLLQWSDTSLPSTRQPTDSRVYVVRYTSNFRVPNPKYKYTNSTKTSVLIDELKASTQYEYAVKVVKGRQESTWSMAVVNTTAETVPSSAPRDLTIVPDPEGNPSTVHIHWQPPKQPNGQLNGYVILYSTDVNKSDREWSIHPQMGDKMNAILSNLLPDTTYYFKIQARNEKGTGPISSPESFRTLSTTASSITNIASKTISTQTLYAVIAGISAMTLVLLLVISLLLCRSKRPAVDSKTRKGGYSSTASSSPRGACNGKNKRESRELHPPDLWIHHEQLELKSIEKNHPREESTPHILRTFQESPNKLDSLRDDQLQPQQQQQQQQQQSRQGVVSYTSDSLYDDIGRNGTSSSMDGSIIQSSYPSATSTIRRTARAKPIMIPATTNVEGVTSTSTTPASCLSSATTVYEPSTGISRTVYPRTHSYTLTAKPQLTFEMSDILPHNLYDPVSGSSMHLPYPTPNLISSNNLPSYSSSGNTSSCAMSPTDASSLIPSSLATSSPSINNLTLRPLPGLQSLRSFTTLTETHTLPSNNTPKHMAVKPQINSTLSNCFGSNVQAPFTADINESACSPLKKLNCNVYNHNNHSTGQGITCNSKPVPHIVNPSFKGDLECIKSNANDELTRELDGIMKDLNAITAPATLDGRH